MYDSFPQWIGDLPRAEQLAWVDYTYNRLLKFVNADGFELLKKTYSVELGKYNAEIAAHDTKWQASRQQDIINYDAVRSATLTAGVADKELEPSEKALTTAAASSIYG